MVGGDNDGTYPPVGASFSFGNPDAGRRYIAGYHFLGKAAQTVRVCTQGRCIARVGTRSIGAINIGDGLVASNSGELVLSSGFGGNRRVVARALQDAPLDEVAGDIQFIAVDIQRERNNS